MADSFTERALAEIDGLHRVLQAWFRAEGAQDLAAVLARFDPGYTMITPAGKVMTLEGLQGGLASMWGSRPGLVMEISEETLVQAGGGLAVLRYKERQHLNGAFTDRLSTVVMLDRGAAAVPAWRHLQETMIG